MGASKKGGVVVRCCCAKGGRTSKLRATHGEASKMIGADEDEAVGRDGGRK